MSSQPAPKLLPTRMVDSWQAQLRDANITPEQLFSTLALDAVDVGFSAAASRDFALKVPAAFVDRMRPGDPRDPLLLQVLASAEEMRDAPGFGSDPVGETGPVNRHSGIIQKYQGRVLLIVSGGCAINCRYCFRRHFPYEDNRNSRAQWQSALAALATDSSIEEVILSGGDPLVATDPQLRDLVSEIAGLPSVRRLRVHSRLPIVIPDRVSEALLDAITHPRLRTVMVIHTNHAREFDASVDAALAAMRDRGITLLNQSVLLANVNDNADALVDLSERMFSAGVLPYYLHLLDKVKGAAHFDVPETHARHLLGEVTARLPGYLVPKLVREEAGAESKTGVQVLF